ncbi:hypothetical protein [Chryseobacterium sp. c4a]|uniref:hypothetical protein n=1 Tax=Chryseobacterium sp. c4a TaxID=1573582 RepID=UPI00135791F3|nr:hypothetical protein [Chryseobacterium sp. c4a]
MIKNILAVLFVGTSMAMPAQVGINTPTPKSTLHINGEMTLTSALNVGGNATTAGNPGNSGMILQSQGAGLPPVWNSAATIFSPATYSVTQTTNMYLPLGLNMPWLQVPNLSQAVTIPKGKKGLIIITGQQCFQQTKNVQFLTGISVGLFDGANMNPIISFTGELVSKIQSGLVSEFTLIPVSYSEFIDATTADVTRVYNIKARVNYSPGNATDDVQVTNNPFSRGDYSQMRISLIIF